MEVFSRGVVLTNTLVPLCGVIGGAVTSDPAVTPRDITATHEPAVTSDPTLTSHPWLLLASVTPHLTTLDPQ